MSLAHHYSTTIIGVQYINDLSNSVRSTVCTFADDYLEYCEIRDKHDTRSLQADLDSLQRWEQDWLIEFSPFQCKAITFTITKVGEGTI